MPDLVSTHLTQPPPVLYGTAWKEDDTARLVSLALRCGFRGIDTANQRKHYHEAAVGDAIAASGLSRSALFVQTKFTFARGQDHRLPYDPTSDVTTQVRQSFDRSLAHLKTTFIDSFVLHGPTAREGLQPADLEAWAAMEALVEAGAVSSLGVSNVSASQLEALVSRARRPPAFVQNRCYASHGWDASVRAVCRRHSIRYQAFSLLTANPDVVHGRVVDAVAKRAGRTPQQVVFRFAQQLGLLPLTGTTNERHMREALAVDQFDLTEAELDAVEHAA